MYKMYLEFHPHQILFSEWNGCQFDIEDSFYFSEENNGREPLPSWEYCMHSNG